MKVYVHKPGMPRLELFESRSLVVYGNGPFEFAMDELSFTLEFENDGNKPAGSSRTEFAPDRRSMKLILNKWDGLNMSFADYWQVGALKARYLYLAMAHTALGLDPLGRTITLSFYLGDPAPLTPPPLIGEGQP